MFDESLKRIQENFPERPQVTYYMMMADLGPKIFFLSQTMEQCLTEIHLLSPINHQYYVNINDAFVL